MNPYLLPIEWIMYHRAEKNKMAESEIQQMQEDTVPENTKKATKDTKNFRRWTLEQFQDMSLAITDFTNLGKPDR